MKTTNTVPLSVLVAGTDAARNEALLTVLRERGYTAGAVSRLDRISHLVGAEDVVIVFEDGPEADAVEVARDVLTAHPAAVIVFSERDEPERIRAAVGVGVSSYVVDGYRATRVPGIIESAHARFVQRQDLEAQLKATREQIEGRKVIDQAKGLLMQERGCSEAEAYARLRRLSMDNGKRIVDIAKDILMVAKALR